MAEQTAIGQNAGSIKTCPHCHKEISEKGDKCSNCNFVDRHPALTLLFGLVGVLIFMVVIDGSSSSAPTTNNSSTSTETVPASVQGFISPTSAQLNVKTQIFEGIYLTIKTPENFVFVTDLPASYQQPKAGNKFISVYVSFDNESQGQFHYNSGGFRIVDPSGGNYEGHIFASKSPSLDVGTLNSSNRVGGYIVFEVPATVPSTQFTVHYEHYDSEGHPISATVDFK